VHDRRSFLARLGASLGSAILAAAGLEGAALACARGPRGGSTVRDSTQRAPTPPMGSGARLGPIGVQLYTVRNEMQKDVAATLARVAQIGYKEVEFAGYFGRQPSEIRALLDKNGLRAPSTHVPLEMVRDNWGATADAAKVIGHEYVVVPWLPEEQRRTLDDFKRLAELFNRTAAQAKQTGLAFAYHNHDFEFTPIAGQLPYDVLLEQTDPSLVGFEMDLYWITKAGQDPLAYFAKYPGRFPLVHVKDSAGPPAHQMTAVGQGTIDWKRIFAQRAQAGIKHYFVEHDNPTDAFASITTSYGYLSRLEV
jgi:sugar phosphate isomerase/epimerase